MSRLGSQIILLFSRPPESEDLPAGPPNDHDPLYLLKSVYPDFEKWIQSQKILDFGCGHGAQAIALWRNGASRVVGLDTNQKSLQQATDMAKAAGAHNHVEFASKLDPESYGTFDVVISQNAMEHFPDPESVLQEMKSAMKPSGRLLITFGPPWYAPYGSHMHFFTKLPWLNLLFSEDSVMRARQRFRSDGAERYVDVESGLNKMSIRRFEKLIQTHELRPEFVSYDCVKGLNFLGKIPLVRELFVNHITISALR